MSDATQPTSGRASQRSPAWRRWVGFVAGVLLGLVLAYSAWGKALDAQGVGDLYAHKGLLPAAWSAALVIAVVGLEAGLGLALISGLRRWPVLACATALMAAFFSLTVYEYFSPTADASSCGCFGNLVVRTAGEAVVGDGLFLLLALLCWMGRPRRRPAIGRWAVPAVSAAAGVALSLAAPSLPVDDWATRLKPGASVAALRLDEVIPELQRGASLVLLIDRRDQRTRDEINRINVLLALRGGPTAVFGLAEDDEQTAHEFLWAAAPAFEVRSAPYMALKPLYRKLPRAFLVEEGVVRQVWNDLPGDAALEALAEGRTP